MATHHGKTGVVKVGGNAVAEVDRWSVTEAAETVEDTAQGDTDETHLVGINNWTGSVMCHYDPSDTNGQEALGVGQAVSLDLYPAGQTSGLKHYTGNATITQSTINVEKKGVVSRELQVKGQGALSPAVI